MQVQLAKLLLVSLVVVCCWAGGSQGAIVEEGVFLNTRPGVIQPYLFSYDDDQQASAIVILFSGGSGDVGIQSAGLNPVLTNNGNFLVRSRELFVKNQLISVVVDVPSDNKQGISASFRQSKQHAGDISKVIDDISARFPNVPIYLVGTSMGTISAAYATVEVQNKLKGLVLTSSVDTLSGNCPRGITIPVLVVHNKDDGCAFATYAGDMALAARNGYTFLTVVGGAPVQGQAACGPWSPHGYLGFEEKTVHAIAEWIHGNPIPKVI
jgi:hypothetical protein